MLDEQVIANSDTTILEHLQLLRFASYTKVKYLSLRIVGEVRTGMYTNLPADRSFVSDSGQIQSALPVTVFPKRIVGAWK